MPPKKKSRETFSAETYSALNAMNLSSGDFSPGAVEALRIAHVQFLSRIASELAQVGNENEQVTIQPHHVDACLAKMGFAEYTDKLKNTTTSKKKASRSSSNKKRKAKWSAEMEAEQERLLAQSKQTIQQQQQQTNP